MEVDVTNVTHSLRANNTPGTALSMFLFGQKVFFFCLFLSCMFIFLSLETYCFATMLSDSTVTAFAKS